MRENQKEKRNVNFQDLSRYSSLGIELPLSIILGLLPGYFIGKSAGCPLTGIILGLMLGLAAVIRRLWRLIKECQQNEKQI